MQISYIINTACMDPWANERGNLHRSAGYSQRYSILKEKVLPAALSQGFDEVIVAGVFEPGTGYQYVPVQPHHRDRRDALRQRELGARYATGDILVFGHDDHALDINFRNILWACYDDPKYPWDLLIPQRQHAITGAVMNNGEAAGYMGGHVLVMKRWLWAEVPWTACDTEYWDTTMTRLWREVGGKLVYADDLIHFDVEASPDES